MRIAVSSSPFRRQFASGSLTQLEWLERCASSLGVDGVIADVIDFPRVDVEYVAQVRKVAVDLGLVPFGLDVAGLIDADAAARALALDLASRLGVLVIRTALPAPGEVPPASFVAAVAAAKDLSRAAKAANVTVLIAEAPETLGADHDGVARVLKDADSAWLRACPSAAAGPAGPRDRYPAFVAAPADEAKAVARHASRSWVILDAAPGEEPWAPAAGAVEALRTADARMRLAGVP